MNHQALSVRVYWGTRRLATHLVSEPGRPVCLGPERGAQVALARGRARFSLEDGAFLCTFAEGMRGELRRPDGASEPLSALVEHGAASETEQGWVVPLSEDERLSLQAGSLRVEANLVPRPKRTRLGADDVLDYRWLNVLLACLFFAALGLAEARAWAVANVDSDEPASAQVVRLRHVLLVQPPPAPPERGPRAPAVSESARKQARNLVAAPRPAARPGPGRSVDSLLAGAGIGAVLGGPGFGGELHEALGGLQASGDGLAGLPVLRGGATPGGGGGDRLVGIGAPGLHRQPGEGAGALCPPGGCKNSVVPRVDELPPATACTDDRGGPCFDPQLIREVIHRHLPQVRYCYERSLQRAPSLEGRVVVAFHVAPSGLVNGARVVRGLEDELDECLRARVTSWEFPANKVAGGFNVTYPFVFHRSGG